MKIEIIKTIYEHHWGSVSGLYKVKITESRNDDGIEFIARTDDNIGILVHFLDEMPRVQPITKTAKEEFLKALEAMK